MTATATGNIAVPADKEMEAILDVGESMRIVSVSCSSPPGIGNRCLSGYCAEEENLDQTVCP